MCALCAKLENRNFKFVFGQELGIFTLSGCDTCACYVDRKDEEKKMIAAFDCVMSDKHMCVR